MTAKKNHIKHRRIKYVTSKASQVFDVILKGKEIIGLTAAIALWLLNIWFAGRIAPLATDIHKLDSRVSAAELKATVSVDRADVLNAKIDRILTGMNDMSKQLNVMEGVLKEHTRTGQ